MDDDLIAVLIYTTTTLLAFLFTAGIHYTSRTVHIFEKICIGQDFQDDYPCLEPIALYLIFGCILLHIFLTMAIARQEHKAGPISLYNQQHQGESTVLFDTIGGHLNSFVLGPLAVILVLLDHTLFTDIQNIYITHSLVFPLLVVLVINVSIITRKKQVRKYIKEILSGP